MKVSLLPLLFCVTKNLSERQLDQTVKLGLEKKKIVY